ncbi:MAG TPA: dienelactone hydrolase family protein [Aldersonia sp.]
MCVDDRALPPELPAAIARSVGELPHPEFPVLTSSDGARFQAAMVEAADPIGPAVVLLPDVRGLIPFYVELGRRIAQAGHHTVVVDYFGRTAGAEIRGEGFEFMPHLMQTTPEQIQADIAAAIAESNRRTGEGRAVAMGFCFGGSQCFVAARNPQLDLAGVVGFHAGLDGSRFGLFPSPMDNTADVHGPVLALFGGDDASIPLDQVKRFEGGLAAAGTDHTVVVYPGAPHSFFDRRFAEFESECDDSWQRLLGFLDRVGGAGRD